MTNLSPDQRRMLRLIGEHSGPVSSQNLAAIIDMPELSVSAASERLSRLHAKGRLQLVRIERSTNGRPRKWYRLSGEEKLNEAIRVWCLAAMTI